MWHSFPSPGSESSRALISSCWSWQCTVLPESPPRDFLWITLQVLGRKYDRVIRKVILSHLSPQWTDEPTKPQSRSQKSRKVLWVINSLSLNSYLPPLPWAALWCGFTFLICWLEPCEALEGPAGLEEGGRSCCFLSASWDDFSTHTPPLQWQCHPVTVAECSLQISQPL